MISESDGNLLEAEVDALVNTVNTVGVMGKGIALQFKRAYPDMFKAYARAAKDGALQLGSMHVWTTCALSGPRFVINFPTKAHWKSSSSLGDIERGLDDLVRVIRDLGIRSIAVPPLGCGHGGLDWQVVGALIRDRLGALDGVDVLLYPPAGSPAAAEMATGAVAPPMTPGRAALIGLLGRYRQRAVQDASLVEAQKLMYFLQSAGEPLGLRFQGHFYGPYADQLRHALNAVEGHYISGFGDGSSAVHDAEPIVLLDGAEAAALDLLQDQPETLARIQRVLELVDGFESPYALELLATVHWLLDHENHRDLDLIVAAVQSWSPRKGRMFTPEHVRIAVEALESRGWIPQLTTAR